MALTNGFQVLELLSRRETLLKPIASSEVEVEVHAEDEDDMQSLGSLLDEHLSYPSSPIPPDLQEAMSPGLSKPGTSFSRVVAPDLFTSGEDVDTQSLKWLLKRQVLVLLKLQMYLYHVLLQRQEHLECLSLNL